LIILVRIVIIFVLFCKVLTEGTIFSFVITTRND
jgi:hypothetical protein